jgi:hypothetical protein
MTTPVYIEATRRKAFACALDWPGWCRSGKTEAAALATWAAYAPRYEPVARLAGIPWKAGRPEVVERLVGSGSTDFGAPGEHAAADLAPLRAPEGARLASLVAAAWEILDQTAAGAPASLRKGPRGGGRDRDAIVEHVTGAQFDYARKIGLPRVDDPDALRDSILERLSHPAGYQRAEKGWSLRYAARRIAWHALDHAWEIEDRSS